jgi:hypothetical protein
VRARALGPAVLLALLAGTARPAAAQVQLARTWEAALEEATARNVPILIGFGKEAQHPFVQLLKNPETAGLLEDRAIVLVGHRPNDHEPLEQLDPKTKEKKLVCPLFPQLTCDVHDAIYNDRAGYFDYNELPAAFFLRPSGDTAVKNVERVAPKQLGQKLEGVQKELGEGVWRSEIDRLEKKLVKGDQKVEKGHLKGALKAFEDELEGAKKDYLKKMVEARLAALDEAAMKMIEEAKQDADEKRRRDTLLRIARELKGRAPAEAAEAAAGGGE